MTDSAQSVPRGKAIEENPAAAPCWFCFAPLGPAELFCGDCGRIQPLSASVDYFAVFSLPEKLKVDLPALEREFYRLSRRLHPDGYARATPQEQQWSFVNSSLLNDAYRTLKDPVRRTEYLLKLKGMASSGEGGPRSEDRVPPDLLEEVFELNMQLHEMRMNRQTGDEDPQLEKDLLAAKTNFDARLEDANAALEGLWGKWDAGVESGDEPKKLAAREELAELLDRRRYIRNLVNSVNQALGV